MQKPTPLLLAPALSCAVVLLVSCANVNFTTPASTQYLYVASGAAAKLPQPILTGYAIAEDGSLSPVSCPQIANAELLAMAGARSFLFASAQPSEPDSTVLSSYSVASNGCLTLQSSTDVTAQGAPLSLFIDRKAETLYGWVWIDTVSAGLRSYSVDASSGALKFTGEIHAGYPTYLNALGFAGHPAGMLAFSKDDSLAVSSSWAPLDSTGIYVYERSSDGTLRGANITANSPAERQAMFATVGAAADDFGHFIVAGVVCAHPYICPESPVQLAIYTLDSQRNLATQDTPQIMATPPSNGYICGYAFSPDNRYFAVASGGGIDVYRWDTSTASLHYLNSIALHGNGFSGELLQAFTWDRYDHLIFTLVECSKAGESPNTGEIQVYSITPTEAVPAPGSPYHLDSPHLLAVVTTPQQKSF